MERMDVFENQNMTCYRKELPDCPVEIVVKVKTMTYRGKEITKTITDWRGRHRLILGDQELDVDRSMTTDLGPKLGVNLGYQLHREIPFTEEECEEGRRRIKEVAVRNMIRAGIW